MSRLRYLFWAYLLVLVHHTAALKPAYSSIQAITTKVIRVGPSLSSNRETLVLFDSRYDELDTSNIYIDRTVSSSLNNSVSVLSQLSEDQDSAISVTETQQSTPWNQSLNPSSVKVNQTIKSSQITTIYSQPDLRSYKNPLNIWLSKANKFLSKNWLILGEVLVIALAKINPSFAATGGILRPEFTISKVGVFTIFFINGIALSLSNSPSELKMRLQTNSLIQLFNFGFIPLTAKLLARFYPEPAFREGLLVLAALPCTINICVAQTNSAGGNMATAIFNAIFSNVVGVVLTPFLAVWLLGSGKDVSLLSTLGKLGKVVILPLILGQLARQTPLLGLSERLSNKSRTLSSCLLLAIVYNVFSDTFKSGIGVGGSALLGLTLSMPIIYLAFSYIFWKLSFKVLPGLDMSTRAAALFCSSQKTLAFGIPFIKTALGHRPDLAYLLAPLLMYAPAQLLLGSSLLVPAMNKRIAQQENGTGI